MMSGLNERVILQDLCEFWWNSNMTWKDHSPKWVTSYNKQLITQKIIKVRMLHTHLPHHHHQPASIEGRKCQNGKMMGTWLRQILTPPFSSWETYMDSSAPGNRLRSAVGLVPLFNKCFSNTYYVPGRGPGTGDITVSKQRQSPFSWSRESKKSVGGSS